MIARFVSSFIFFLLLITNVALESASEANFTAKPGCKGSCGNVGVPYPFGIGANCSFDSWFEVSCNETSTPPTILLKRIKMEVLNFSYRDDSSDRLDYLGVKSPVITKNCGGSNKQGVDLRGSPFFYPQEGNRFIAAGCNNRALVAGIDPKIIGCVSACIGDKLFGTSNRTKACNGSTCCQTEIPSFLKTFNATFDGGTGSHSQGQGCKLAFLAHEPWLNANTPNLSSSMDSVQALLDWVIPVGFNGDLGEYACFSYASQSSGPYHHKSGRCYCYDGYRGNPYLTNGCQDIDECLDQRYQTICGDGTCVNTPGYFTCDNQRSKTWITALGLGLGFGVLCLVIGGWRLYRFLKKRRKLKLKKKFFKRNGGLLLQQQVHSREGSLEKTMIFTSKELDKATDHFNNNRVLGQGGQGTVFKGMLADGRIVAVKKSKAMAAEKVDEFINEVVILSQINHRNVVKLLGCCLETEVPLLVYEFIPNGTLFQYLHDQSEEFPLSWETPLRIAKEDAEALAYLHSSASIPIYHRDIKSTNILLDEKFKAKVSDFGTSRSISIDQTHLTTNVYGTFGYLDPEYFQSSQFTEKSDVYSFGVVLVELLTGEKPISLGRTEESRSLATHFIASMEENRVLEIVDGRVVKQAKPEQLLMVAKLAYQCLSLSGKKRPTMKQVAAQLEQILPWPNPKDSNVDHHLNHGETYSLKLDSPFPWDSTSSSTGSKFFH